MEGALQDFEYSDPSGSAYGALSPETFRSADDSFDDRHDEGNAACSPHKAACCACTLSPIKSCLQSSMWHLQDLVGNAEAAAALAAYKEKHAEPADMSNEMDVPSGLTQVGAYGVSCPHLQTVVWGVGAQAVLLTFAMTCLYMHAQTPHCQVVFCRHKSEP